MKRKYDCGVVVESTPQTLYDECKLNTNVHLCTINYLYLVEWI